MSSTADNKWRLTASPANAVGLKGVHTIIRYLIGVGEDDSKPGSRGSGGKDTKRGTHLELPCQWC